MTKILQIHELMETVAYTLLRHVQHQDHCSVELEVLPLLITLIMPCGLHMLLHRKTYNSNVFSKFKDYLFQTEATTTLLDVAKPWEDEHHSYSNTLSTEDESNGARSRNAASCFAVFACVRAAAATTGWGGLSSGAATAATATPTPFRSEPPSSTSAAGSAVAAPALSSPLSASNPATSSEQAPFSLPGEACEVEGAALLAGASKGAPPRDARRKLRGSCLPAGGRACPRAVAAGGPAVEAAGGAVDPGSRSTAANAAREKGDLARAVLRRGVLAKVEPSSAASPCRALIADMGGGAGAGAGAGAAASTWSAGVVNNDDGTVNV